MQKHILEVDEMVWMLMLLQGCGPTASPEQVASEVTPILPSPDASLYATGDMGPRDPIVAAVVERGGLPWQESLSGAATYLALYEPFTPELAIARWGAVRAGYPHPIHAITFGTVAPDSFPDQLLEELQRTLRPGDELGLIRIRTGLGDRWIALFSHPRMQVATFAREYDAGETIELAGAGHWRLQDPDGMESSGSLPLQQPLLETGEWWLELRPRPGGPPAVSVPFYVGMVTPPAPVVPFSEEAPDSPGEALDEAYTLINQARDAFGRYPLSDDETLEMLAQYPLERALSEDLSEEDALSRLRGAGFIGGPAGQGYCEARTVALCLDTLMWNIDSRRAMLEPGVRLMGAATEVRTDQVSMFIYVASE